MTLKPTAAWTVGGPVFLVACSALMVLLLDGDFEPARWSAQELIVGLLSGFFLLAAVELPTKKLVLKDGVARKRDWFITREHQIPARVSVGRDAKGRVCIIDAENGTTVTTLTREFGPPDHVERALAEELQRIGRLATVG